MANQGNRILDVDLISVSYGPVQALNNVSLYVERGEIVVLLGANGAGKSTMLECILGLRRVKSGVITFMGEDITNRAANKIVSYGLCLVPEGRGILPLMTVLENLQLGAHHLKTSFAECIEEIYQRFPILADRSGQMAGTLSGGEQQMLAIARAMMSRPKLMMLDEPSLGLAPVAVEELFRLIVELNEVGHTILLSEQNAHKALECAHRGYVFQTGSVVLSGVATDLKNNVSIKQAYLGG